MELIKREILTSREGGCLYTAPGFEPGLDAGSKVFRFPAFFTSSSHMTIKRRVFLAIMECKLELGLGLVLG